MERLNKFLAHAGVGSRRFCDTLIAAGRVKVDGVAITDLGLKIDPERHQVAVDDHAVRAEKPVYWVVNKPVGYLCTDADPSGRPRAVDLLPHVDQRVYTVGRLDESQRRLAAHDQRRRPGDAPHAPALRRTEDVSRAGRGQADARRSSEVARWRMAQ